VGQGGFRIFGYYPAGSQDFDSTLDVAHELAERGAPAGTLIVADAQRAGRGRLGRAWRSEPGRGVWSTVIERPEDVRALDVLSLRVGLYCAESLDALARRSVGVKWPNDLVVDGRKLGGVLVEARWSGDRLAWVAIGVGVNVLEPNVEGAAGLPAGTRRIDALAAIVRSIRAAARAPGALTADELRRWATRDTLEGARIVSPAAGIVKGISATGALLVSTEQGIEEHRAGSVERESAEDR